MKCNWIFFSFMSFMRGFVVGYDNGFQFEWKGVLVF